MAIHWPDKYADISTEGAPIPKEDGDCNDYVYPGIDKSPYFDKTRIVVFINGMGNTPENHAQSALALSLLQMCRVVGVYNKTVSGWRDFLQCVADKNQFDGPFSLSANNRIGLSSMFNGGMRKDAALAALARNPAQGKLYLKLDSYPKTSDIEIFAHSQGNLILSNVLQAMVAVGGRTAISKFVVHTFGSPAVNWPQGLVKHENAFTFDYVSLLAGMDKSFTISKVGMPKSSWNPITHAFLEYMEKDPAFVINRYRVGSFGLTASMDEEGLATTLAAMGPNAERVFRVFERLRDVHWSDSDDVAELYVHKIKGNATTLAALKIHGKLPELLIKLLEAGWTSGGERDAINILKAL